MSSGRRILVVGCGQLGSRHLQAAIGVAGITAVDVVDPFPASLEMGRQRVEQVADRQPNIQYRWLTDLAEAEPGGDLCIVATQAAGRAALVRQVAETRGYQRFLLEKVVTQSVAEYDALLALARARDLSVWINCKTRAYPFHKRAKAMLGASGPIILSEVGGNHGLANNGVHTADLFSFYNGDGEIAGAGSAIDATLHGSKRGAEVFDLSGTLHGTAANGGALTIAYQSGHMAPPVTIIQSPTRRFAVDHFNRWGWEADAETNWVWRPMAFEGDLAVSVMSRAFVRDILETGACELPTLADCYPAHRFVLTELLPHFQRLLGRASEVCPVT